MMDKDEKIEKKRKEDGVEQSENMLRTDNETDKNKKNKHHTKKVRTIALSIFLAVIVWFTVIYVNDPDITTTVSDLDVRFIGEMAMREKGLVITNKKKIPSLSVVVTGKRSDLMNFMDDIYVQVNVDDVNSTGEYTLSGTISTPTTRITVERENYGDIPIEVERLVSKDINVTVKQTGTLKNKVVHSVIDDPKVTITGAASELDNVAGGVATVDISNLEEDGVESVNYLLVNESGGFIEDNETLESTRSSVNISNKIYNAKTLTVVPALTAELEAEYLIKNNKTVVTPQSITVGTEEGNNTEYLVARIDSLPKNGEGEYEVEVPGGVYIPEDVRRVKVRADIVKKSIVQLDLSVQTENVPQGLTASADSVTVMVWGEEGKVNQDTVQAYVDVSGLGKGTYSLPVKLKGENVGLQDNYTVNVNVE